MTFIFHYIDNEKYCIDFDLNFMRASDHTMVPQLNTEQEDAFISYMESHSHLARGRLYKLSSQGKEKMKKLWNRLAKHLRHFGLNTTGRECKNVWLTIYRYFSDS